MNKSLRRHRSIALLLVAVLLLSGCVGKDNTVAKPGPGQVIDGAGVIKNIPDDPASATIASVYAVSVPLIVALDLSDRVLAVNVETGSGPMPMKICTSERSVEIVDKH